MGIQVYLRRFAYNQGQQQSILSGTNVTAFYNSLGSANVLNYVQDSKGLSLSFSYPLKRSFARLGLSIGYDISSIKTESTGAVRTLTHAAALFLTSALAMREASADTMIAPSIFASSDRR